MVQDKGRRRFLKYTLAGLSSGLVASYPVFIERYLIQVNTYEITVPHLPEEFDGFTLVQLTDLHYGFLVPLKLINYVVEKANSIPSDVIICTGDYIHERNSTVQIDRVWPVLSKLKALFGVYSIMGNHDHWASTNRSLYWLNKSGQNLRYKVKSFERSGKRVWLGGAGEIWSEEHGIDRIFRDVPAEDCKIVLAHNPDTADKNFETRIDLMISGHTHGGQVNIPFLGTPILPVQNKRYSSGIIKSDKTTLFISRGIGWAIIPVRFNCYPEIAVVKLRS